jgi:diacylglycerol kinase (ATP)
MPNPSTPEAPSAPDQSSGQFKGQSGLKRLGPATRHSMDGLMATWRTESAFRQELALGLPLLVVAWTLEPDRWHAMLLSAVIVGVWVAELLNTGLEALCDRLTAEVDPAIKVAKDAGSAAVFLSLLLAGACWGLWLFEFLDRLT